MPRKTHRIWVGLAVVLLALASTAGNCGEQLANTFDQDASIVVNPGPQDATVVDRGTRDRAFHDTTGTDQASGDAAGGDAASSDAAAIDGSAVDGGGGADAALPDGGDFHPAGWLTGHRAAALLGQSDCRTCHGSDLAGGAVGVSCDLCHQTGWRTNCTYCHGGTDNLTGAPPVDLRGRSATSNSSVGSHTSHVAMANRNHPNYACSQCHVMPANVLSTGHLFDSTPGQAELVLASGLSPRGSYDFAATTCNSVYCHGNGRVDGTAPAHTASIASCAACHPDLTSSVAQWQTMSGRHASHLRFGFHCDACHGAVVDTDSRVVGPDLHVNGIKDVQPLGGTYDGTNCTTSCHTGPRPWPQPVVDGGFPDASGRYHSDPNWTLAAYHGLAAEEGQAPLCNTCHGADLNGQGAVPGCNGCHTPSDPPAWRTNCVFCHGGYGGDTTGAPPWDIHNRTASSALAVGSHREHVAGTTHLAYDCIQCHVKPASATSPGHMFDSTPNRAELTFTTAGALSSSGSYSTSTTTCSNLYCHGTGRVAGNAPAFTTTITTCAACHPFMGSESSLWQQMSGRHALHLGAGDNIQCWECHGTVLSNSPVNAIINGALHVNGVKDVQLLSGSFAGGSCSSVICHGEDHGTNETW